jgi:hypothetical protein
VRPERDVRYGAGDGTSYENAWNGLASVDWAALAACASATVLVCGERSIALEVRWPQ